MRVSRWIVILVALALALTGCGNGGEEAEGEVAGGDEAAGGEEVVPDAGGELESNTLRVAFASEPDFTQIMNFKWLDDMREQDGIEVKELFFDSSQDAFRALVAGEAEIAVGTILSAIALVQEGGEDVKVIASDLKAPDYLLIATPEVESLEDLEGKKVGISTPGDISDTLTRVVLKREGVEVPKVNFLQVGGTSARMSALLEGQIAAGAAHAAEGLSAVEQGLQNLFAYGKAVPDYLQHGLIVKQDWLDANPNLAQATVNRFVDATRWAADNKAEYIAMSEQYVEGLSESARDQAYEIFQEIGMFAVNGGMSDKLLQNTLDIEQEVGSLAEDAPPIEEWSDPTFVERYLEENGEV
jgi:NitT/TauT family transport system substrate-binding protein